MDKLIQIGMILLAAWGVIAVVMRVLPWISNRMTGKFRYSLLALAPAVKLVTIIIASGLVITRIIEPSFENLVAVLGALGLALGFAFKDYVGSLIAGVVTLYEMPYRPGDWIEINGAYGEVKTINMRSVDIVTPDDTLVVIPHLKLWDQLIFNSNNGGNNLMCVADFYLHPQHNAAQIKDILYDVALTSAFVQLERPINVIVSEKPWGTHYRLKAYPIDPREQFHFITDLTIRGKAAVMNSGAQFIFTPTVSENAG